MFLFHDFFYKEEHDHVRWLEWADRPQCSIFQDGLTALSCHFDYMHCKYLGVDQIAFGSIMELLTVHMLPNSPKDNLQTCWQHILASYKSLGITERYRGMKKLTLFQRKKQAPKLKGRAKQIAALGEPLLALWEAHMNPAIEVHAKIRTLLKINVAMERMMKQFQAFLAFPPEEAAAFTRYCFALCQIHLDLGKHFRDEELNLFPDLPKMHMLLHVCQLAHVINPRLTWCFRGEDLQKVARTLAASCARGLMGPQVTLKMVSKLRVAWHLRLQKILEE